MEEDTAPQGEPRCASCGRELVPEDQTLIYRTVGLALVVMAAALCFLTRELGAGTRYLVMTAAGAALFVLWPKRLQWRCFACGTRYPRRLPPRGMPRSEDDAQAPPEEEDDTSDS